MGRTTLRAVTQPELHVINGAIIIPGRVGARPASGGYYPVGERHIRFFLVYRDGQHVLLTQ